MKITLLTLFLVNLTTNHKVELFNNGKEISFHVNSLNNEEILKLTSFNRISINDVIVIKDFSAEKFVYSSNILLFNAKFEIYSDSTLILLDETCETLKELSTQNYFCNKIYCEIINNQIIISILIGDKLNQIIKGNIL